MDGKTFAGFLTFIATIKRAFLISVSLIASINQSGGGTTLCGGGGSAEAFSFCRAIALASMIGQVFSL